MNRYACTMLLALALGCAHGRGTGADGKDTTTVELTVHELDDDMQADLDARLKALPNQKSVTLKSYNAGTAIYVIESEDDPVEVEKAIASISRPTLKNAVVVHKVELTAADTTAPELAWMHPVDGQVLSQKEQNVLLEIPDKDVKEVLVNGHVGQRFKGHTLYKAHVTLAGGKQQLLVVIKDRRGNQTTRTLNVTVDDSPRTIKDMEPVKLDGHVPPGTTLLVEGEEVKVDVLGYYQTQYLPRPGQKQVQLIAIDENGKRSMSTRALPGR